ncbi:MAG: tRNA 2-thiouridine(34) synthase MnmA, partial [Bacilli bacterium]
GGVDSSVALILLKNEGYDVEGLFMKNWDSLINNDIKGNPTLENDICTQEQDYNDAKEVCDKLGIKLHRVDFVKEYWDYVFTYFLEELKKGRTPNPDVMCNKYIKFDMFIKEAKKYNADYIATGHYARMINGNLYKGVDQNKDQTYFLSQLTNKQLENVLFPVGDLTKDKVRKIAKEYNLITKDKKDSTGICFIGERNFRNFLSNYLPNKPGKIVNIKTKEEIGNHIGLMHYTIGQRKGLNIGGTKEKLFVVGKNLEENILYVAEGENNEYLYSDSCIIDTLILNTKEEITNCNAKFRYRSKDVPVKLEYLNDEEILVKYESVKSVTPGQVCALYIEDRCIGSGIIKEVRKDNKKLWYVL